MKHKVGMSTNQIIDSPKNISSFIGCFPCNNIPIVKYYPSSFIVNTDKNNQPGTHWVAIYMTEKTCFFFDSFGESIQEYDIKFFLKQYYQRVIYNLTQIQDYNSIRCGEFCVNFVRYVTNKNTYVKFINEFVKIDLLKNDVILKNMMKCR